MVYFIFEFSSKNEKEGKKIGQKNPLQLRLMEDFYFLCNLNLF